MTTDEQIPSNTEEDYALQASIPLKTLYIMLLDIYDGYYPIPFIEFRETFDKYLKITKNNLIDSIILLIYGIKFIEKVGTGEEDISVDRIKDNKYDQSIKYVRSPFYRFIANNTEIRIGYDYAIILDYIDGINDSDTINKKFNEIEELVEQDVDNTYKISRWKIHIDVKNMRLEWKNDTICYIIDITNSKFTTIFYGEKYDNTVGTVMELQAVPKNCIGIESRLINNDIIVTFLESGDQFCYIPKKDAFDMIYTDCKISDTEYLTERNYILNNGN